MSQVGFDIIRIEWLEKKVYTLESLKNEDDHADCLYQTYGDSPIYGRDVLLYIGQTNSSIRRTIEHLKSDFSRINNLSLVVGKIVDSGGLDAKSVLDISESILITMLKPSYNSSNIKDTSALAKKDQKYLVMNLGNRCSLPLEVSNYWW